MKWDGCGEEKEEEVGGAEAERSGGKGGQEWKIAQILESRTLFSLYQTITVYSTCNNSHT